MPHRSLTIPASFALLLAAAAPGLACGFRDGPCPPTPTLAPVVIPPIVGLQSQTASAPIVLRDGPPPAADEQASVPPATPYDGANGLTSITDLDRGVQSWATIAPGEDFAKLPPHGITWIGLTQPAVHPHPLPPKSEISISENLKMEVPAPITQKGVPGVDQPNLASGNRSLWFGRGDQTP